MPRKIVLFFLGALFAVGLAGCGNEEKAANPVGAWSGTFNWGAGPGRMDMHIYSDNTVVLRDWGLRGTWDLRGDKIILNFNSGSVYYGTVTNNNAMTGTMNSTKGQSGTWVASKVSDTP